MIGLLDRFVGRILDDLRRRDTDRVAALEADVKALHIKAREIAVAQCEAIDELATLVADVHGRLGELYLAPDNVEQKEPGA